MVYMTTTPINEARLVTIRQVYKTQFAAAKLLDLLISNRVITLHDMKSLGLAKSDSHARTLAHRLRKFLATKNITLRSAQWTGYWLDVPGREQIEEELNAYGKTNVRGAESAEKPTEAVDTPDLWQGEKIV